MMRPMTISPRCILIPLAVLLLAACQSTPVKDSDSPPNIIFLLADDQSADTLSSAGHPVVQTPHLDQLASSGMFFANAFAVQPICAPSRFAIFTGQYERTNGLGFSSPYEATEAQWTDSYPALFRRAGYHTGFVGKFGVEFYEFRGQTPEKFDFWKGHDGWLSFFARDNPENTAIESYVDSNFEITTEIMGEAIDEFLDTAPSDKPFHLSVSFSAPHNSMTSSMYSDADTSHCETSRCRVMGVPANQNPRLKGHPVYEDLYRDVPIEANSDLKDGLYAHLPREVVGHEKRKFWYEHLYYPETNVEHMIRYYQQISGIDKVVGKLVARLKAKGLLQNTVIIYTSDHGYLTGHYGIGGKGLLYDQSVKVPLIVFDPRSKGGQRADALVLTVDLAPTMLQLAGLAAPEKMQGRSLVSLLENPDASWRDSVLLESLTTTEDKTMSEAIRTHDWKYIRYFSTPDCPYDESDLEFEQRAVAFEQLFDLRADPMEKTNLAQEREFFPTLQTLRTRLGQASQALSSHSKVYKAQAKLPNRPPGQGCW